VGPCIFLYPEEDYLHMERSKGVKVSKKNAERVRRRLREQEALDSKKAKHQMGVIFPVSHLNFNLGDVTFEVVEDEFDDFPKKDGFESLTSRLGCSLSSYDVIGDVAVLEIPQALEKHEEELGATLLESKKQIKCVFKKSSSVEGEKRVRKVEWIAGEKRTETVHREHGCEFKLDITKVFFSPRLSYERQRIRDQVRDGEIIVDMFSGVGPYSIVIAKHRDVRVYGYDINKTAIHYFDENIRINKVGDRVKAAHCDCRELTPKGAADRAIMNLPKGAKEFLDTAIDTLKEESGIIHYYGVSPREQPFDSEADFIVKRAEIKGRTAKIMDKRIVRSYSPSEVHVAIDVEVRK
jgi:tRNA (guanine37-N1)-methyltransferase